MNMGMGFNSVEVYYDQTITKTTSGHVALAVKVKGSAPTGRNYVIKTVDYNGSKYYYAETTDSGCDLGRSPQYST